MASRNWKSFVRDMTTKEEREEAEKNENSCRKSGKLNKARQIVEAFETWALGKKLGIVPRGNEEEIVKRLQEMERERESADGKKRESIHRDHQ